MTIDDIRDLIIKGEYAKALDAMLELVRANNDDDMQNNLILQSGRFQGNEKQNRLGLITADNYTRTRNQITMALLSYLDDMKNSKYQKTRISGPSKKQGNNDEVSGKKILFLASNPSETGKLQLEKEHSRISRKVQESENPNAFPIIPKVTVTLSEFQESLITEEPNIVHFSGHGEKGNSELTPMMHRGIEIDETIDLESPSEDTGIILFDESRRKAQFVKTDVIQYMFKSMIEDEIPIELVVFNACYSEGLAKALAKLIPYVIGTSWSVGDEAAIAFATGFYFGIARGKKVELAYKLGVTQAMAYNEPKDRFILYKDGKKV